MISVPEEFKQEPSEEGQRYGNIPSEKVRAKRERAVKKSYEDMLASDPDRKSVHKRKPAPKPVEEPEEIEDEEEYEDDYITPRFRVLRVIFGLLSIVAFGFFTYKGVISGLDSITSGSNSNIGTFYVIMALLHADLRTASSHSSEEQYDFCIPAPDALLYRMQRDRFPETW